MFEYKNAIQLLLQKFPVLRKEYESDVEYYKNLPYVFYESVFVEYIVQRIKNRDEKELTAIFKMVEQLLLKSDPKIQNLMGVAIVESLFFEPDFKCFWPYLYGFCGELTKKNFDDCIQYKPPV